MKKEVLLAIATLMGTIIGAGILGLPYLVSRAGIAVGIANIIFVTILVLLLHLFVGEISLRTKERHQLTGYARIYLGKIGKEVMTIAMVFVLYGALTAYILGEGDILYSIFQTLTPFHWSIIFFIVASLIVYRGVKATSKTELWIIVLLILVVVGIGILSQGKIDQRFLSYYDWSKFYLPYGAALFAMMGVFGIPEMREIIADQKDKFKKAIIIGTLIPTVIYIIFTFVVVGIIGNNFTDLNPNQRVATVALSLFVEPEFALLANLFGVFAMFTSFLALGLALVEMYSYDYKVNKTTSWIIAMGVPLLIVLLNLADFIKVIEFTGAVADGILGILIVVMFYRAKRRSQRTPEYKLNVPMWVGVLMCAAFLFGMLLQVF